MNLTEPNKVEITKICDVRNLYENDKPFIYSTFLLGLYHGNEFFNIMKKNMFMEYYKPIIHKLVENRLIKVVCLKEDPNIVLGYGIMSKDEFTLDWIHVKQKWRNQGIAKLLYPSFLVMYTHFSMVGLKIAKKKNLTFNPFEYGG